MYKAISCWSAPRPGTEEEFEQHYRKVHVPLALRVPNTRRLTLTRTSDGLEAEPPAFYRVAEMFFSDRESLEAAMETPEWEELRADTAGVIERFGVSLVTGLGTPEEADEVLRPTSASA
ncbi:MAG: hypothetical protein QOF23_1184 [Solirubrobacterales bacterium]|jgi:uncharacterized protein (TIGR02118 family)|nr:hypothetical protein [Solirubrobacterales bacterium]